MNKQQWLLNQLAQECNEVAKACSKAILFGLDNGDPNKTLSNKEEIQNEFNDFIAVVELINESFGFKDEFSIDRKLVDQKKEKVKKFMSYSAELGILND